MSANAQPSPLLRVAIGVVSAAVLCIGVFTVLPLIYPDLGSEDGGSDEVRARPAPSADPPAAPAPAAVGPTSPPPPAPPAGQIGTPTPGMSRAAVVAGDVPIELRSASGTYSAGDLPPGKYDVFADFGSGYTRIGPIEILADQALLMICEPEMQTCMMTTDAP